MCDKDGHFLEHANSTNDQNQVKYVEQAELDKIKQINAKITGVKSSDITNILPDDGKINQTLISQPPTNIGLNENLSRLIEYLSVFGCSTGEPPIKLEIPFESLENVSIKQIEKSLNGIKFYFIILVIIGRKYMGKITLQAGQFTSVMTLRAW